MSGPNGPTRRRSFNTTADAQLARCPIYTCDVLQKSTKRGRPRLFDEDAAIDAAVDLFWERGYRNSTTRELETALGMHQPSIYNAFGSKKGLLLQAIDRYERRVEAELLSLLDGDDGYGAVEAFFRELGDWIAQNRHRGCLVVNLMMGEADDDAVDERVRTYRSMIFDALHTAVSRSEPNVALATDRANVLLAAVLGLHLTARTAAATGEVPAMVIGLCHQIDEWRKAAT